MNTRELNAYLAKRAAQDGEELRCVIRADQEVMYRHIEVVLRGAGLAKIGKIVFAANSGEEPTGDP